MGETVTKMPSLRRRHREPEIESAALTPAVEAAAGDSAKQPAAPEEPSPPTPAAAPSSPPADTVDDLRSRLAAAEQADRLQQAERTAQVQAEIASHYQQAPQQQQATPSPEDEERAGALVAKHPGVLQDVRVQTAVRQMLSQGQTWPQILDVLEQHLEPRIETVEPRVEAKPVTTVPKPPLRPMPPQQMATEPQQQEAAPIRSGPVTSAPPTREVPSYTGKPTSSRVDLSAAEVEVAHSMAAQRGMSPADGEILYAREKLRMLQEKAADPDRFRSR
jgi:hypothetical protein